MSWIGRWKIKNPPPFSTTLPVISTPPRVVSNLVFVHHQPITWQPCPYPQHRRDAAAWWGFCILNSISWWDKGCRNRALPLCQISVFHKPFLTASSDTDCGEKRHWGWGVSKMWPNSQSNFFFLFSNLSWLNCEVKLCLRGTCFVSNACKCLCHCWGKYLNIRRKLFLPSPRCYFGD